MVYIYIYIWHVKTAKPKKLSYSHVPRKLFYYINYIAFTEKKKNSNL